jgi:hypothetical protein
MTDLPEPVAELATVLAALPGAVAVALGGSRALGVADAASDWDFGLYYRGTIDLAALSAWGTVHPPGAFGRLLNGGAFLHCGGVKVDVGLRDLDVVEHWTRCAGRGEFAIDHMLGFVARLPTYLLAAELGSCRVLSGSLPEAPFPAPLAAVAPPCWRFFRSVSLDYARAHARRGNVVGATGQAAKAALEEAHAVLCGRGQWACNEKRLIAAAGLTGVQPLFGQIPGEPAGLVRWVDLVAARLGVSAGEVMPWSDTGRGAEPGAAGDPARAAKGPRESAD